MTDRDDDPTPEDASAGLTRRRLFRQVGAFGLAGAIAWSAPSIRSVRLDQAGTPGSPSPVTAGSTVPVGTSVPTGGGDQPVAPAGGPTSGGRLPVTGTEAAQLALFGGGAVVLGRMLTQATKDPDGPRNALATD
jgi:hypothetical protein